MKGIHGDNLKWLDPWGQFSQKEPELVVPDFEVHNRIVRKLRNTAHLKLPFHRYSDAYAEDWYAIQELRWFSYVQAYIKTLTVRVQHAGMTANPQEYAKLVLRAARLAERAVKDRSVPIWFELGNEPNLTAEGWDGEPVRFNAWYMAVVNELREARFHHGLFYPGLNPKPNYLYWYHEPSTQAALAVSNGIALHTYEMIVDGYIEVWSELIRLGYGHYPKIISEAAACGPDRLAELRKLTTLDVSAYHVFIVDGKSNGAWPECQILTEQECREMETW